MIAFDFAMGRACAKTILLPAGRDSYRSTQRQYRRWRHDGDGVFQYAAQAGVCRYEEVSSEPCHRGIQHVFPRQEFENPGLVYRWRTRYRRRHKWRYWGLDAALSRPDVLGMLLTRHAVVRSAAQVWRAFSFTQPAHKCMIVSYRYRGIQVTGSVDRERDCAASSMDRLSFAFLLIDVCRWLCASAFLGALRVIG
jgi:hypothetical protein